MARRGPKPSGTIVRHNGKPVAVRVRLLSGARKRIPLPTPCSEAMAEEKRALWSTLAAEGKLQEASAPVRVDAPAVPRRREQGETVAEYAKRWADDREARGLTSVSDDRLRLAKHVLPAIGDKPMASVTRADLERIVEALDASVLAGSMRWKTAINIWGGVTKLFDDARASKKRDLRVREDNPADGVRGPDRGETRMSAYLFPREALALVSCEAVPIRWRVNYAVAFFTGLRRGELVTLRASDVHEQAGYLSVATAHNRATGEEKSTKGRRGRRVPIEPALAPLLAALAKNPMGPDGRLLDIPASRTSADKLREHCRRAGLTRAELYAHDDHRRQLNFHDGGRHTYSTWLALAGVDALVIKQRGGWGDLKTPMRYIEEAESVGRGDIGTPFPALPGTLIAELTGPNNRANRRGRPAMSSKTKTKTVEAPGIETDALCEKPHDSAIFDKSTVDVAIGNPAIARDTGPTTGPTVRLLREATERGDWPEVARLAAELEGRR